MAPFPKGSLDVPVHSTIAIRPSEHLVEQSKSRMNVLVINPPGEHTVPEYADHLGRDYLEPGRYGVFPPLGALYVLSHAEARLPQHRYFLLDCPSEKISHGKLRHLIPLIRPDVVGISSYTISLLDAIKTAEAVRDSCPETHICLGGPHPTAYPREAAALPHFDSIIAGEGESAFTELIGCLEEDRDFSGIRGLYTEQNIPAGDTEGNPTSDRFISRPSMEFAYVEDIDELPFPNRRHIAHTRYYSIVGNSNRLATMLSSRGCPFSCTFCDNPYKQYRAREIGSIIDEIRECVSLGYREIRFYDELFNASERKLRRVSEALLKSNLDITWEFRGRVDALSYDALALAKRSGLRMISLGVETGSDEGLELLGKGFQVRQVEEAFDWCRRLGIKTVAYFMIGLPHERTKRDVRNNVDFLIRLNPDYAMISILNLYPHTALTKRAVQKGFLPSNYWNDFAAAPDPSFHLRHWTEFLSENELVQLHRESYKRFYFRAPYVLRSMTATRSLHGLLSNARGLLRLLG